MTGQAPQRVGVIGAGKIGGGVVGRLLEVGHDVTVHDRDRAQAQPVLDAGARWAPDLSVLAEESEVVLTSLPGPDPVQAVLLDPDDGLLRRLAPGRTVIDLSTISVAVGRAIGDAADERGVSFLDAPVTAAFGSARDGELTILVGGEPSVVARWQPLLEQLGSHVAHVGPVGAGTAAKLATQCIGFSTLLACAEGLFLASMEGVDVDRLVDVLATTPAQSWSATRAAQWVRDADLDTPAYRGSLATIARDMGLVADLAGFERLPYSTGAAMADLMQRALARGWGDRHYLRALDLVAEDLDRSIT